MSPLRLHHLDSRRALAAFDPAALTVDAIEPVVQVNGKIRARISAVPSIAEDDAIAHALADPNVAT